MANEVLLTEGLTDSPAVASAVAYFLMAAAGALTLYATSHWSPERREKRTVKRRDRAQAGRDQTEGRDDRHAREEWNDEDPLPEEE